MFTDDDYIKILPDDPHAAARQICSDFDQFNADAKKRGLATAQYDRYIKALSLLQAICEVNKIKTPKVPLDASKVNAIEQVVQLFADMRLIFDKTEAAFALDNYRSLLADKLSKSFAYELTDGDIEKIQQLINQLRECIQEAELDDEHKARLFRRLERLQSELHKRLSDLDRFWGLIGDASVVLAKLGENAKPIVDRVREIAEIVWNAQTRSIGLPSSTPLKMLSGKTEQK